MIPTPRGYTVTVSRDIEDRLAIQDVLIRYATALDSRDWALLDSVFAPDCQVQYPGSPALHAVGEVAAFCERALRRFTATQHLLANFDIRVDGDRAASVCRLQATHVGPVPERGAIFTLGGNYQDELVRTADDWRITSRTLTTEWTDWPRPAG
jgi:hypothetical protein